MFAFVGAAGAAAAPVAVLLDFAVQGNHVLSLRDIYALRPSARARINSIYMTSIFAGGAVSSAVTGVIYQHWGWSGVALFAAILMAGAGLVWVGEALLARGDDPPETPRHGGLTQPPMPPAAPADERPA